MHRTEGTNNSNNIFVDGPPGTCVEEKWLNAVQEELCYVIEQAGLTLPSASQDTRKQLYEALKSTSFLLNVYQSTMVDSETFEYGGGASRTFLLDPNGATRTFNPSGVFPAGFEVKVVNNGGGYNIIFDSAGSAQIVTPGTMLTSIYDGTSWL